jgi:heptosyltransferase III
MSFKGSVNQARRCALGCITKHIGGLDHPIDINNINVHKILISRPNCRLGNQILMTPIIQEVTDLFPNCTIDLFVRGGLALIIFKNYKNIDRIICLPKKPFKNLLQYLMVWVKLRNKKYDLIINVDNGSSSGKLSTEFSRSPIKIFNNPDEGLLHIYNDYVHMAKNPVYNLRRCFEKSMDINKNKPLPLLDLKLDLNERNRGKELLQELVNNNKKTICIYTFATGQKCYSPLWWKKLYDRLKDEYGTNYNIIEILPIENISQINFAAQSFYSRNIREMAALIANSTIFVGADSGIMHLACSSGTPTIGLFSVTNAQWYEPYGNKNMAIHTNGQEVETIIDAINKVLIK